MKSVNDCKMLVSNGNETFLITDMGVVISVQSIIHKDKVNVFKVLTTTDVNKIPQKTAYLAIGEMFNGGHRFPDFDITQRVLGPEVLQSIAMMACSYTLNNNFATGNSDKAEELLKMFKDDLAQTPPLIEQALNSNFKPSKAAVKRQYGAAEFQGTVTVRCTLSSSEK